MPAALPLPDGKNPSAEDDPWSSYSIVVVPMVPTPPPTPYYRDIFTNLLVGILLPRLFNVAWLFDPVPTWIVLRIPALLPGLYMFARVFPLGICSTGMFTWLDCWLECKWDFWIDRDGACPPPARENAVAELASSASEGAVGRPGDGCW